MGLPVLAKTRLESRWFFDKVYFVALSTIGRPIAQRFTNFHHGFAAVGYLAPFGFHLGQHRHVGGHRYTLAAQESVRCLGGAT
jgi:hypothetical protein